MTSLIMRGETAMQSSAEEPDPAEPGTERRASVTSPQSQLKKVSHSPFHDQYKDVSAADADVTGQNTAPFHAIFAPPTEFQSSPLDLQSEVKTPENGDKFSEPQKDPSFSRNLQQDLFRSSTMTQNSSSDGHLHGEVQDLDSFKVNAKTSELFRDDVDRLFQPAKGKDLLHPAQANGVNLFDGFQGVFVDPFKAPSNQADDLFQSPQPPAKNPFYSASTSEADLFQAGPAKSGEPNCVQQDPSTEGKNLFGISSQESLKVFSSLSNNTVDPFPSPITRDLFQDFSGSEDPFGITPSKQYNPFRDVLNMTPDVFKPLPPKPDGGEGTFSTPLLNSTPELKLVAPSSPDLFKATPSKSPPAVRPKPVNRPQDLVVTTPQGTKHEILRPTPFSQALNLSPSQASMEMTHAPFFRRPPKPLPRTRPPRTGKTPKPENPPTPAKPTEVEPTEPKPAPKPAPRPPKPVLPHKPQTPESKPVDSENYAVFEDILLTGQEKCVEDWPEDSPQLDPDFKPSGKLRLRRESLKVKADSDGGSGEDQDASGGQRKKKDRKFRMPVLSRRGSKDKFPDDAKEGRSMTLPMARKSSRDYLSTGENDDGEENWMDYKKKPLKTKVTKLLRRASTTSAMLEEKHGNGYLSEESKEDVKKSNGQKNSIRRRSEGTALDDSASEEKNGGGGRHAEKRKSRVKIQFVPHRGFAITLKKGDDETKGAHGYTSRKGSKDKTHDDDLGAHGYTPRKKSQDDDFEDVEEIKNHQFLSSSKAAFMDDKFLHTDLNGDEDAYGSEDCKPKKSTKMKLLSVGRRSSKEDMLDNMKPQKKKSSFSAEELEHEELNGTENGKQDFFAEDEITGKEFMSEAGVMYDDEDEELETCKPKKKLAKRKVFKRFRMKVGQAKASYPECEDPPGATSSDFLSEAARAEWLAAQQDERALAGLEDEDEDGDTDSLMEWWNTVEQWDEVPSDEESKVIEEDESKSFTILADKVQHGLRVFNKVFTERAEVLWQLIITLHAIADDISNFHHKAKIAGITGGTTTAVGGVAAITGLALAPFTFGASLVVTAVGVGVATAGGITSASAAISDNVNNLHDQKKVEEVLKEYEDHLLGIGKILHFVNHGVYKLRGHPFLRSGTQHYSQDWEIRQAVQIISLIDSPVMRATEITDDAVASVQGLFKGMDQYFIKESRELKKSCKKEMVGRIKEVANRLNDTIVELNTIREELQDATGYI